MEGALGAEPLTHRLRDEADPPLPLARLGRTLTFLLGAIAALYVVGFLAELGYVAIIQDYLGGDASAQEVEDAQVGSAGVQFLASLVTLVAAGFFIAWTHRAYDNLGRTSVADLRFDRNWAIAAWFIPVVWWIRPKQVVDDVWRASDAGVEVRDSSWRERPVSPVLHWWWAAWVASALVGIAAVVVGFDADATLAGRADYEREQEAATIAAVGMLCTIAAAVLAVIVVRRITERQERVREAVLAAGPAPAAEAPAEAAAPAPEEELIPEESRWRCPVCGWVFRDPADGRRHLERHHPGRSEDAPRR